MTFGEKLVMLRKERQWTQKQVGDKSGISPNTIGMYEKDLVEPTFIKAACLSDVFGVSLEYLAGKSPYRTLYDEMDARLRQLK